MLAWASHGRATLAGMSNGIATNLRSLPPGTPYAGGQAAPAPTPKAPTAAALDLDTRIALHGLITQAGASVTRSNRPLLGNDIGLSVSPYNVFQNTNSWPVTVRLVGDVLTNTIRLNFYVTTAAKPGQDDFRDYISNGLGGVTRNETGLIWVPPGAILYAQRQATWGTPDASDTIRVGIVDPQTALDPRVWPSGVR